MSPSSFHFSLKAWYDEVRGVHDALEAKCKREVSYLVDDKVLQISVSGIKQPSSERSKGRVQRESGETAGGVRNKRRYISLRTLFAKALNETAVNSRR